MLAKQIAEYRRMAADCVAGADATGDSAAKLQWLGLAERWKSLADKLEAQN